MEPSSQALSKNLPYFYKQIELHPTFGIAILIWGLSPFTFHKTIEFEEHVATMSMLASQYAIYLIFYLTQT